MSNYNELSPQSRVWIYQSNRPFSDSETTEIQEAVNNFTQQWAAHGHGLKAYGNVYHQRFVVLMVDESQQGASGCSIDSSVHFLKDLQQKYAIDLFDRLNMAYRNSSNEIATANRKGFKQLIQEGAIDSETIVFNNLVQNKAEFETKWEIPIKESWHKRVFRL